LRIALAEASDSNYLMRATAGRLRGSVRATGLVAQSTIDDAIRSAMRDKANAAICRSMTASSRPDTKVNAAHG
jgi:hypothetical protein